MLLLDEDIVISDRRRDVLLEDVGSGLLLNALEPFGELWSR